MEVKASIGVQTLHKLQDQSWPRDTFWFYWAVNKEAEKATVAKLEGFIAMKTKAITNSVMIDIKN